MTTEREGIKPLERKINQAKIDFFSGLINARNQLDVRKCKAALLGVYFEQFVFEYWETCGISGRVPFVTHDVTYTMHQNQRADYYKSGRRNCHTIRDPKKYGKSIFAGYTPNAYSIGIEGQICECYEMTLIRINDSGPLLSGITPYDYYLKKANSFLSASLHGEFSDNTKLVYVVPKPSSDHVLDTRTILDEATKWLLANHGNWFSYEMIKQRVNKIKIEAEEIPVTYDEIRGRFDGWLRQQIFGDINLHDFFYTTRKQHETEEQ